MTMRTTTPTYRFHNARLIISTNPSLKFSPPFLPEAPSHRLTLPTNTEAFFDSLRRLVPFARFLLWSSIVTPLAKWEKSDGISLTWRLPFANADIPKFEWDPWLIFMATSQRFWKWLNTNITYSCKYFIKKFVYVYII